MEHALSSSNELHDITATLLTEVSEVSNTVGIESVLQKLSGEHLKHKTSVSSDDARLDIVLRIFGTMHNSRT